MHNLIRHIVKALTTLCLLLINIPIYPISYSFRSISETDGLSDLMVSSFYKDSLGYIWIGTASSVERFDGVHLKHYPILGNNEKLKWVNVITETTGNRIWIGNDMGLWTVHKETEKLEPFSPETINCGVRALLPTRDGGLYIGSEKGLFIYRNNQLERLAVSSDILSAENFIVALGDWLLEPARIHSLNSMGHNWWTSCVCQGGILALSLQNELPEVKDWVEQLHESLPEWFDFAGDALQQKAKSFDEAGGMYESLNYANFGIQEALLFRIAWINTHPGQNPGNIPQLAKLPNYFSQVCYPRTGMLYSLNFGDSHKNVSAESSMMLLYALGLKDPTILWYITQVEQGQHRDGFFLNRPMGFLYTPDLSKAPITPDLKTSQLFSSFETAIARTGISFESK
jgi:hypothetical protein